MPLQIALGSSLPSSVETRLLSGVDQEPLSWGELGQRASMFYKADANETACRILKLVEDKRIEQISKWIQNNKN